MRIVRITTDAGPRFGHHDDEQVHLLDAEPYDGRARSTGERVAAEAVEVLPPVSPRAIFAVGRNYAAHIEEMGLEPAAEPSVFMKPPSSLLAHGGTLVLPPPAVTNEVQHEVELAVVIGRAARNVPPERVTEHVFGYTIANDVSARDLQRRDSHVIRAKGFDTFCPIGPWVDTSVDPVGVPIRCWVNGALRQDGSTSQMIFDVPTVVSSISRWTTLLPGDVILTGSPAGTSTLEPGDEVALEVSGIGMLSHRVAATLAA